VTRSLAGQTDWPIRCPHTFVVNTCLSPKDAIAKHAVHEGERRGGSGRDIRRAMVRRSVRNVRAPIVGTVAMDTADESIGPAPETQAMSTMREPEEVAGEEEVDDGEEAEEAEVAGAEEGQDNDDEDDEDDDADYDGNAASSSENAEEEGEGDVESDEDDAEDDAEDTGDEMDEVVGDDVDGEDEEEASEEESEEEGEGGRPVGSALGRAVQVDPRCYPRLTPGGRPSLVSMSKQKYDVPPSNFGFSINLRRYSSACTTPWRTSARASTANPWRGRRSEPRTEATARPTEPGVSCRKGPAAIACHVTGFHTPQITRYKVRWMTW